ncbi:MAG: YceD family protein, partial [Armatimonadota bacterium]
PEELRAVDANDTAPVVEGTVLDVGELLRQSLILEAPLQPLCREDCPGVGGGAEGAPEPDTHRPLAALAALLRDGETE